MKPLTFAARSLRREFLHGELATLAAALVLAVAALAAVATLANRVERAIVASAAELIGGDLGIASSRALPDEFRDEAKRSGLATVDIADFPSVVFAGDKSRLADVRAAGADFPLRGVFSVRGASGRRGGRARASRRKRLRRSRGARRARRRGRREGAPDYLRSVADAQADRGRSLPAASISHSTSWS